MVSVIGAGISGLYASYLLARKGYKVNVYEALPSIALRKHCTGLVSKDILRFWKDVDVIERMDKAVFVDLGTKRETIVPKKGEALLIDRVGLERSVYEATVAEGVVYHFKSPKLFTELKDEVVIIADGALSRNTRILGNYIATLPALQFDFKPSSKIEEAKAELFFRKGSSYFFWAVHSPSGNFIRFGSAGKDNIAVLQRMAKKIFGKFSLISRPFGGHVVTSGLAKTLELHNDKKHIFVIGDAAGMVKPFSGGGVLASMRAASLLAEAIDKPFGTYSEAVRKLFTFEFFAQKMLRRIAIKDPELLIDIIGSMPAEVWEKAHMDFYTKILPYAGLRLIKHLPRIALALL